MNCPHRKLLSLLAFVLITTVHYQVNAQQMVFERKDATAGNFSLSITNVGTLGNPQTISRRSGTPSFQFPKNSGQEHLFEGGIWIGAVYGGSQIQVSTSAVTSSGGYVMGSNGFEFTNDGSPIIERSSLPSSDLYDPNSVSHQDIIAKFSDRRTHVNTGTVPEPPITGHVAPLFADVELTSYNWNFGFTENFSILKWNIKNTSTEVWDSVFVGFYMNLIDRNINTTLESGTAFFNKLGTGYIDTLYTIYSFDSGSEDKPKINTYGGMAILGTEYKGKNYHPGNPENLEYSKPFVTPNYWLFSSGSGVFQRPNDDNERYTKMATPFKMDSLINDPEKGTITIRKKLAEDGRTANGNYISFISIGPFNRLEPGEEMDVYTSFVGGLMPADLQGMQSALITDNAYSKSIFIKNIQQALATFRGEDKNNNGQLDLGEDINGNGKLDRFLIPEPPHAPKLRAEVESGKVTLYWDELAEESVDPVTGLQDFEGYNIYRSKLGDDLNNTILTDFKVIKTFDKEGNTFGYNTGFDEIRMTSPKVFDDEPGVQYWYKYEVEGLLNGWQYLFAITAFDASFEGEEVESLETSPNVNSIRIFPGTPANENFKDKVGVYPNPYRVNAAWDGNNELTRKMIFYNLPSKAEIRVYTLSGDIVAQLAHDGQTYNGDIRWFNDYSASNRKMAGGEHAWDVLSQSNQNLATGLYFYTVKDLDSGKVQRGKFVIIK